MIVLGVDPGLADTGWGQKRVYTIATELGEVALKYKASVVSMEDIFFTKNISSAIPVAKVIGAVLFRFSELSIPVHLFSPLQIKTAVTGMGRAEKMQVQEMVKIILHLKSIPKPDHAADALADCICYCSTLSLKGKL